MCIKKEFGETVTWRPHDRPPAPSIDNGNEKIRPPEWKKCAIILSFALVQFSSVQTSSGGGRGVSRMAESGNDLLLYSAEIGNPNILRKRNFGEYKWREQNQPFCIRNLFAQGCESKAAKLWKGRCVKRKCNHFFHVSESKWDLFQKSEAETEMDVKT